MHLAEELRQVRDKYTMACPDKPHTPFSVMSRAADRLEVMEAALEAAAAQFERYAQLHKAKSTADGDAKALTNAAYAEECRAALEQG